LCSIDNFSRNTVVSSGEYKRNAWLHQFAFHFQFGFKGIFCL
jgi:hypothetical protein